MNYIKFFVVTMVIFCPSKILHAKNQQYIYKRSVLNTKSTSLAEHNIKNSSLFHSSCSFKFLITHFTKNRFNQMFSWNNANTSFSVNSLNEIACGYSMGYQYNFAKNQNFNFDWIVSLDYLPIDQDKIPLNLSIDSDTKLYKILLDGTFNFSNKLTAFSTGISVSHLLYKGELSKFLFVFDLAFGGQYGQTIFNQVVTKSSQKVPDGGVQSVVILGIANKNEIKEALTQGNGAMSEYLGAGNWNNIKITNFKPLVRGAFGAKMVFDVVSFSMKIIYDNSNYTIGNSNNDVAICAIKDVKTNPNIIEDPNIPEGFKVYQNKINLGTPQKGRILTVLEFSAKL